MLYLIFNLWSIGWLAILDRFRLNAPSRMFFFLYFAFLLSFLPAFQYNVGTDYFTYISIFENESKLELFFKKGELAFFYLVVFLKSLDLPSQSIFIVVSIISSVFILLALRLLNLHGYRYSIVFLCFFLMTGMLHNQMNGLRNYLAVYSFVCALLCKFSGRYKSAILLGFFGVFFHQTFYFMLPFLLIPSIAYELLAKKTLLWFPLFFIFWGSGFSVYVLEYVVLNYAGFYSHYIDGALEGVSLLSVLTKAYYLPLQLWFIFWVRRNYPNLSLFKKRIIGFWLIGSCLYLGLLHSGLFFRTYHYFVFFSIIPAYHFLTSRQLTSVKAIFILYLMAPYIFKVIVFPVGEYDYQSYLFSINSNDKFSSFGVSLSG